MSVVDLAHILFVRQRRILLAVFLAAFCAGALATFRKPKQSTTTATLFVG